MPSTYTPISSNTLNANAASVTFSSIPSTYTDLIIVCNMKSVSSGDSLVGRFNGVSSNQYSRLTFGSNGSIVQSTQGGPISYGVFCTYGGTDITNRTAISILQINNYSNANITKTVFAQNGNATIGVSAIMSLWNNTAAINSILLYQDSGNLFAADSTFTIYGIKSV